MHLPAAVRYSLLVLGVPCLEPTAASTSDTTSLDHLLLYFPVPVRAVLARRVTVPSPFGCVYCCAAQGVTPKL